MSGYVNKLNDAITKAREGIGQLEESQDTLEELLEELSEAGRQGLEGEIEDTLNEFFSWTSKLTQVVDGMGTTKNRWNYWWK